MPLYSGEAVPSNRAWAIVTDGSADGNVSAMSTCGVAMPSPRSVRVKVRRFAAVGAEIEPLAAVLQPKSLVVDRRHIFVSPWGETEDRTAVDRSGAAAPALKVITRFLPAGSSAASSLSDEKEIADGTPGALVGFGVADGASADGLGAAEDGAVDGDARAEAEGVGDGATDELRRLRDGRRGRRARAADPADHERAQDDPDDHGDHEHDTAEEAWRAGHCSVPAASGSRGPRRPRRPARPQDRRRRDHLPAPAAAAEDDAGRSITAASTQRGRPAGRPNAVTPPISIPVMARVSSGEANEALRVPSRP